jgi:hypothetical protein
VDRDAILALVEAWGQILRGVVEGARSSHDAEAISDEDLEAVIERIDAADADGRALLRELRDLR